MKYDLTKLSPKETTVNFSHKEIAHHAFTVNKITIGDDAWLLNEFGGQDGIRKVFENGELKSLVRIFYRLLSEEDKLFLASIQLSLINEDGES